MDLLVGAPGSLGGPTGTDPAPAPGRAFIFFGPGFTTSVELVNPNPAATNAYGWAVAAGNVGDPRDAAYVAAPLNQPTSGSNFGTIYYYLDPSNDPNPSFALDNPQPGTAPPSQFGVSMIFLPASAPSASTLVIGATGFSAGTVDTNGIVWSASATAPTTLGGNLGPCIEPSFGAALALLPVIPGAGGDVVITNPFAVRNYASGLCEVLGVPQGRVHSGSPPSGISGSWYQSPDDSFGTSVATGGAEGGLRTAVGAPSSNQVFVFDRNPDTNNPFGGPGIHPITGIPSVAYGAPLQILDVSGAGFAGRSLAFADVNGDSIVDLIVGAPGGTVGGQVIIFFGPAPYSDSSRVDLSLSGLGPGSGFCVEDFLAWSISVGDLNGDGELDIAAGRPCDDLALTPETGSVTVFFGPFAPVIPAPVITVEATDPSAAEAGADPGAFTFTRTGSTTNPVTVTFTVGGTAAAGTDYGSIGTALTIPAGQATATVTITPTLDALIEGDETVILTLAPGAGYTVGSPDTATATIADYTGGLLLVRSLVLFGIAPVGSSSNRSFVIANGSTSQALVVRINAPTPSPPFSLVSGGGTVAIAPGLTHQVKLSFTPTSNGLATGTLMIDSTDTARPMTSIDLAGLGR